MNNQRVPVGFLELLGIKAGGDTVRQTAEFLQPVIELRDYYGSILWGTELASVVNGAPPNPVTLTVPAGELWFLNSVALTSTTDSATPGYIFQRILIAPIGAAGQGAVVAAKNDLTAPAVAGLSFEVAWQPPYPWILRPGSVITGNVLELGAGNVQNILQALFYRVPF